MESAMPSSRRDTSCPSDRCSPALSSRQSLTVARSVGSCQDRRVAASAWNSLEIAKLVVAVATPLIVAVIGIAIGRSVHRLEDAQWANRKLVERRLEIYGEMAPLLNDLYCFFRCVGRFREITPPDALALKRDLDKLFYVNRYLFASDFAWRYERLMAICFQMFSGTGEFAKIRSSIVLQREKRRHARWEKDWEQLFDPEVQATPDSSDHSELESAYRAHMPFLLELHAAYSSLMVAFAEELGVNTHAAAPTRKRSVTLRPGHRSAARRSATST
jgi:hypothetical protein